MMTRRLAAALAVTPLVGLGFAMAAAPVAAQSDDLSRVAIHLKAATSMTAAFSQTDRAGKTLTGQLTLKRPGKIRFQYQKGVPILLVADGKALTYIDYSVKQVQRWPVGDSPLSVLIDPDSNLKRFAKLVPSNDPNVVLVLAKDPKRPQYGAITMAFTRNGQAPGGLMLSGWVTLDSQNNRTSVRLSDQSYNVAVSDRTFTWSDPRPAKRGR